MGREIKSKVGKVHYNNFGSKMVVVEYINSSKAKVYFEEYD